MLSTKKFPPRQLKKSGKMRSLPELLNEHVDLEIECIDRVYLNGYVPNLQRSGGLVYFLKNQKGEMIPSPASLNKLTNEFVAAMETYAATNEIPLIRFEKGQRKEDLEEGEP